MRIRARPATAADRSDCSFAEVCRCPLPSGALAHGSDPIRKIKRCQSLTNNDPVCVTPKGAVTCPSSLSRVRGRDRPRRAVPQRSLCNGGCLEHGHSLHDASFTALGVGTPGNTSPSLALNGDAHGSDKHVTSRRPYATTQTRHSFLSALAPDGLPRICL